VFGGKRAALGLVALAVGPLVRRRHPFLRSIHLRRAETELADSLRFSRERGDTVLEPAVLDAGAQGEGRHRPADRAVAGAAVENLRVALTCDLAEPVIDHVIHETLDELPAIVFNPGFAFTRTLAENLNVRGRRLRIGDDAHQRLRVDGNRAVRLRRDGSPRLHAAKRLLD